MTREEIEQKVIDMIVYQVSIDASDVTPTKDFVADLGFDSLDSVEMTMVIEDEFGFDVTDEDAEKLSNLKLLVDYVQKRLAEE